VCYHTTNLCQVGNKVCYHTISLCLLPPPKEPLIHKNSYK
jgi:hypothetical protein